MVSVVVCGIIVVDCEVGSVEVAVVEGVVVSVEVSVDETTNKPSSDTTEHGRKTLAAQIEASATLRSVAATVCSSKMMRAVPVP